MDKALVRYIDNGSTRYDGKEYAESLSKLRRDKSATGPLEAGEMVTIKTKSCVWTAVVVNPRYEPPQKKRRRATAPEKPKQSSESRKKKKKTVEDAGEVVLAFFSPSVGEPSITTTPSYVFKGIVQIFSCHSTLFSLLLFLIIWQYRLP